MSQRRPLLEYKLLYVRNVLYLRQTAINHFRESTFCVPELADELPILRDVQQYSNGGGGELFIFQEFLLVSTLAEESDLSAI